jgi:hypothetical protein
MRHHAKKKIQFQSFAKFTIFHSHLPDKDLVILLNK